jgi:dTDP-4-dehydrorhamnose 3,5-epimerase
MPFRAFDTGLPGVLLVEPQAFGDARGLFYESWHARDFAAMGIDLPFVQDNHSVSSGGVLRGLHYQREQVQGKLVRVVAGEVFNVAVDIRRQSPRFGRWTGQFLSADNRRQLWIPPGFAHGFLVVSDRAEVLYKTTDYYAPQHERVIAWNDPAIGIEWPLRALASPFPDDPEAPRQASNPGPTLSARDRAGLPLAQADVFA